MVNFYNTANASQVKWNKTDENLLATSHEVDVRIWDKRVIWVLNVSWGFEDFIAFF